jgi:DNA-binding HxlR family transcriptional regulator
MKSRASAGRFGLQRSACPIANALDLLGDKWTLLVVRDLMFGGKRLYGELAACEEHIPTNILADRLKRLEEAGLVRKTPYQDRPVRYEYGLTASGQDLFGVIAEIVRWANEHIPGTATPPKDVRGGSASRRPASSNRRSPPR